MTRAEHDQLYLALLKVARDLVSTIEATGGVAAESDGDGVAADPEWLDLRLAYDDAKTVLARIDEAQP